MLSVLLAIGLLSLQEPQEISEAQKKRMDDLQQKMAALERQNEVLRIRLEALDKRMLQTAQEVFRLRQALRSVGGKPGESGETPVVVPSVPPPKGMENTVGPDHPLKGIVRAVFKKEHFIVIEISEPEAAKSGYRFEIVRKDERKAVVEFEKYLATSKVNIKCTVVEGAVESIEYGDEAVAFRRIVPTPDAQPPAPEITGPRRTTVTEVIGTDCIVNGGLDQGIHQTDLVYVYRDGKLRAVLRVEEAKKDYSIAKVVEGKRYGDFGKGDEVSLKEIRSRRIGRIKLNSPKPDLVERQEAIMVDIGSHDGVQKDARFEVRRNGRSVGQIVLTKVDKYFAYAALGGTTKASDLEVGDIVEEVE